MSIYTSCQNGISKSKNKQKLLKHGLNLVDAPPSAGKTYQTGEYIVNNLKYRNHMIVQPTNVVMSETVKLVKRMGLIPVMIDSKMLKDSEKVKVLARSLLKVGLDKPDVKNIIATKKPTTIIDTYLKHAGKCGHVLIITHAAYLRLPYLHNRDNWAVYFDETVQIDRYHEFDVSQNVQVIKGRVIMSGMDDKSGLALLKPVSASNLKREISDPDDVLKGVEGLLDFLRDVNDCNQDTFVDPEQWESLGTDSKWLNAISIMKSDKFKGVTLLSANIEYSMMHHWFTMRHGLKTITHPITNELRYGNLHHLKDRVRVHCLTKGWHTGYGSKNLSKQFQPVIDRKALEYIGDRDFIYAANNFYSGELEEHNRIPVIAHGLNEYDHETIYFHNVSQNRNSNHIKLLVKLGFSEEFVTIATVGESAFQSAMRTNLRRKESNQVVDIILVGDALARQIATRFGLGVDEVNYIGGDQLDFTNVIPIKMKCTAPLYNTITGVVQFDSPPRQGSALCVGFHHSADGFNQCIESFDSHLDIFEIFENLHGDVVNTKNEAIMFNPSIFTDEGLLVGAGVRSTKQMVQVTLVSIDIDGGDKTWQECAEVFDSKAGYGKKHSFMVSNTFSSSPEKPNRFRLIFPLKVPVYAVEHYKQIVTKLVDRLPQGVNVDPASWSPVQDFYCPCTNAKYQDNKKYTFFKKFSHKTRQFNSRAIDPESKEYKYIPELVKSKIITPIFSKRIVNACEDKVQQYIAEYQNIPVGVGLRRNALNKLALRLTHHLDRCELESILYQVVGDESKMIKRVPKMVDDVFGYIEAA